MGKLKKILIADDDPSIVDAMQVMLETEGYEVESTLDGGIIYKIKENPDLILLDIWMSGQDGRDICRFLKSESHTKSVPIIMISASRDIAKSANDAGADDFLAKPFEMQELVNKVDHYLHN